MLDRTQAPPIKDAVDFEYILPGIQSFNCDNGVPLYAYRGGSQPVVQIEWVFEAGIWYEDHKAVAQSVAALLKSGTQSRSEFEINEALEYYGASLRVATNNDYATVTLHCLTKHLDKVLPVIQEILSAPSFPEAELEIYKQNALQGLAVKLLQCDFVANRHIEARLFGLQHPYGRYVEAEDLKALNREMLVDFFNKNYQARNCKIFVSGLYEENDLQLINKYFGDAGWSVHRKGSEAKWFEKTPEKEKNFHLVNNESGVQAAIRMARPFVSRRHPDFVPFQVLNTLFGGYFGSRLMSSIREEKGYTYGIYSYIAAYRHEQMMIITSEVGRDVAQASLDEIAVQMQVLREQIVDDEELLLVKNYILGGLLSDLDGPFSIMRLWKNMILNGEDEEVFNKRVDTIKQINAASLQRLAQEYLKPEDYYTVTVI